MKNARLREAARRIAQGYAPVPTDSFLIYAILGASLVFITLAAASGLYGFDSLAHPVITGALTGLGALAGLTWRIVQTKRHRVAHQAEYDKASDHV
jgi:hypothetical protein